MTLDPAVVLILTIITDRVCSTREGNVFSLFTPGGGGGGYPGQVQTGGGGGYPTSGTPPSDLAGRYPTLGVSPQSDLVGEYPNGGVR